MFFPQPSIHQIENFSPANHRLNLKCYKIGQRLHANIVHCKAIRYSIWRIKFTVINVENYSARHFSSLHNRAEMSGIFFLTASTQIHKPFLPVQRGEQSSVLIVHAENLSRYLKHNDRLCGLNAILMRRNTEIGCFCKHP